jgi:hypothetical protein
MVIVYICVYVPSVSGLEGVSCDLRRCVIQRCVASELKTVALALEFSVAVSDDPCFIVHAMPIGLPRCPVSSGENAERRGARLGLRCPARASGSAPTRNSDSVRDTHTVYLHRLSVDGTILPMSVSERSDRRARRGGRGQRDSSLSTCTPRSPNYFTDLSSRTARNPIGRALQKSPSMCPGASPATAASASCAIRWHSCQSGIISKGCST